MSEAVERRVPPSYVLEGESAWSHWGRTVSLVRHLTRRQRAARYRGSALGFFWSLLNPILMMCVYTFVFQFVLRLSTPGVPYPVFFLTGILAWNFIHIATMNSAVCIVDNHSLIDKAYFPRIALPLAAVLSNATNYLVAVPVLVGFNLIFGIVPDVKILLLPLALLLLLGLGLGLGLLAAAITPFFRDLIQLLELFLLAWFFASPVLYPTTLPETNLPAPVFALYQLNPVVGAQSLVRGVFLGQTVSVTSVLISAAGTLLLLLLGLWVFARAAPRFTTVL